MRNIVLIGMPGAGKSTVGVLLAKTLQRSFLDTDLLIQVRERRSLQAIIDAEGMDGFLDREAAVVASLDVADHVIATGGSVVYRPAAMAHLRAHGIIVFLSLPLQAISGRLHNIATRGVAMHPGQQLTDLFAERQPLYARYADLTLDATGLTPEETVTQLVALLEG